MSTLDDLARKLADDTFKAMEALDNDRLYVEVAEIIGASSQTLEEAYLTEVRVRLAYKKARGFLVRKVKAHQAGNG
ncbi:hypothetical protein [Pseudooceanicola aestuarii]|uniref:hypothetical protein n=1 Tax=Pseudooceanicola aestuarii TaxID=2697319 RepID=UPI0013D66718|nr:hypothetical protein [Pseudooceanicola aestuarii]